jgi:hypothetical protein
MTYFACDVFNNEYGASQYMHMVRIDLTYGADLIY